MNTDPKLNKINIQIIEDNDQDISLLVNSIKKTGLEVDIIINKSIREAIEISATRSFDCIFLDYYFPEQNGLDFLQYYNKNNAGASIIMVTSEDDIHLAVECMKMGASDFLSKSQITPASLAKSLRYILQLKEARKAATEATNALRESELKIKNIVAKSPILLFHINIDGTITLFKGKAAHSLSVKPEKVTGQNLKNFGNTLPMRMEDFKLACETNQCNYRTEVDGHFFDVNYIPIYNTQEEIIGMMGVAIDITSFTKNEEVLINQLVTKEESSKIKEQFLANMSHEIRTPIHGIISLTQFVLNTTPTEEQKNYLDLIRKSADTLLVIVNDILDLSKIDSGKMTFEEIPFNLKDTFSASVAAFIPKTIEKKIELKTEISNELPQEIIGDPVRLTQIINNLLGNAIKFTDKGYVFIGAKLSESNEEYNVIEFTIKDSGIGISADKIDSIFESFTQAGNDITRKFGGTGLGLTITKQLIERQNGTIHVESVINEGTTFKFCIPYKTCSGKLQTTTTMTQRTTSLPPDLRILVAEDHDINRFIIQKMFKEWGINCDFAITGIEALEQAKKNVYDIVLMDIEMPDMNGYRATELIRSELPYPNNTTPIIAMTGHAMNGEKEKCISIGMNDYISKPFKPEELKNKILELTNKISTEHNTDSTPENKTAGTPIESTGETMEAAATTVTIDLAFLREISDNNDAFFVEFIQMFLANTPKSLCDIQSAIPGQDYEAIRQAAHKAKPSFNYVGLKECSTLAAKIEELAKKKEGIETITENINKIQAICAAAYPLLENEINTVKNTL
jgi:signal transduction histidine kinase/DNA-binding response OmpR family regulator